MPKQPSQPPPPLEYLNCIFYLDKHPEHLGEVAAAISAALFASLPLPPFEGTAMAEYDRAGPYELDPGWQALGYGSSRVIWERQSLDPDFVKVLQRLPDDAKHIYLGTPRRGAETKWRDYIYSIHFVSRRLFFPDPKRRGDDDRIVDSNIVVSLSTAFLKKLGDEAARRAVDALVAAVASLGNCYYGFLQPESGEATNGTRLYAFPSINPYSGPAVLQDAPWWRPETDRRRCMRRIDWGMFLGPKLADLFRAGDDLLAQFEAWRFHRSFDGAVLHLGHSVRRFKDGSAFLTLTPSPLDFSDVTTGRLDTGPTSWAVDLAGWLHVRCRQRQLLA